MPKRLDISAPHMPLLMPRALRRYVNPLDDCPGSLLVWCSVAEWPCWCEASGCWPWIRRLLVVTGRP